MKPHFLNVTIRSTINPDVPPVRERINYARPASQEYLRKLIYAATRDGQAVHIEAMSPA